jgi:recombinational DNA repair protein (RecF pathway)
MLKTFELVGFAPTIDRCGNCGAQTMLAALSPSGGGILCGPCASTIPDSRALSPDAIEALRNRRVPFGRGDVREILRFIISFAGFHAPAARGEIRIAALTVFPKNPQRKLSREGANV